MSPTGSKAEVTGLARHVRSTLKSGHRQAALIRLFGANATSASSAVLLD